VTVSGIFAPGLAFIARAIAPSTYALAPNRSGKTVTASRRP
jgi:hypothetical protein